VVQTKMTKKYGCSINRKNVRLQDWFLSSTESDSIILFSFKKIDLFSSSSNYSNPIIGI